MATARAKDRGGRPAAAGVKSGTSGNSETAVGPAEWKDGRPSAYSLPAGGCPDLATSRIDSGSGVKSSPGLMYSSRSTPY